MHFRAHIHISVVLSLPSGCPRKWLLLPISHSWIPSPHLSPNLQHAQSPHLEGMGQCPVHTSSMCALACRFCEKIRAWASVCARKAITRDISLKQSFHGELQLNTFKSSLKKGNLSLVCTKVDWIGYDSEGDMFRIILQK
jgi:hypothetical protein